MRELTYITWFNFLAGYEYWPFIAYVDHQISVEETGETKLNIFSGWPKSYGPNASTVRKQTFRRTRKQKVIRTQAPSRETALQLGEQLKSAILVELLTTRGNKRTVSVDTDSIVVVKGANKIHNLSFTITYTDDYPTQHA